MIYQDLNIPAEKFSNTHSVGERWSLLVIIGDGNVPVIEVEAAPHC